MIAPILGERHHDYDPVPVRCDDLPGNDAHSAALANEAKETALAEAPSEAISAFREAYGLLDTNPAASKRKAEEALSLLDDTTRPIERAEIELLIALADFYTDRNNRRKARSLEGVMDARSEASLPDTALCVRAWLALSSYAMRREDWRRLMTYGEDAENSVTAVAPDNISIRAVAITYRGIGLLRDRRDRFREVTKAIKTFERGIALFPPQENFESFDTNLALLLTWRSAAIAVLKTLDNNRAGYFMDESDRVEITWPGSSARELAQCSYDWLERPSPTYPKQALRKGYVGAAIFVYDVDREGRVINPRTLVEVPTQQFGPSVLETMPDWRLAVTPDTPDVCLKDLSITFEFIID